MKPDIVITDVISQTKPLYQCWYGKRKQEVNEYFFLVFFSCCCCFESLTFSTCYHISLSPSLPREYLS